MKDYSLATFQIGIRLTTLLYPTYLRTEELRYTHMQGCFSALLPAPTKILYFLYLSSTIDL